jgi:hypothetical protein
VWIIESPGPDVIFPDRTGSARTTIRALWLGDADELSAVGAQNGLSLELCHKGNYLFLSSQYFAVSIVIKLNIENPISNYNGDVRHAIDFIKIKGKSAAIPYFDIRYSLIAIRHSCNPSQLFGYPR